MNAPTQNQITTQKSIACTPRPPQQAAGGESTSLLHRTRIGDWAVFIAQARQRTREREALAPFHDLDPAEYLEWASQLEWAGELGQEAEETEPTFTQGWQEDAVRSAPKVIVAAIALVLFLWLVMGPFVGAN